MPSAPSASQLVREFDDFARVVSAGTGQHRNFALGFFKRDLDDAKVLVARQRRALARGAAGDQKVDPGFDLPPHQTPQRGFIQGQIRLERRDQRRSASGKHVPPPDFATKQISLNSWKPCLPTTHSAAFRAPRAKPSRLRAVWRSVMVSAAESKPISCVPGMVPARLEPRRRDAS